MRAWLQASVASWLKRGACFWGGGGGGGHGSHTERFIWVYMSLTADLADGQVASSQKKASDAFQRNTRGSRVS